MKLPRRLPYEAIVLAGLLLGSCKGPALSERQRDQVNDIADAAASENAEVQRLKERVSAIEERLHMGDAG